MVVALMSAVKTSVAQYIVEANRGDFRCERFRLFSPMGPDGTGQPQPGDRCRLDNVTASFAAPSSSSLGSKLRH